MTVNWNNNQILSKKRRGDLTDPFISIEESLPCINSKIILTEVPNFSQKVLLNYSEEYSSIENYTIGDLVYYEISGEKQTYECIVACVNKIPTNTSYWIQINFIEVLNNNKALNKYEYYVDYINCIISTHSYFSNKNLICKYLGEGLELIPVTKVWTKEENGDITETLDELITSIQGFENKGTWSSSIAYLTNNIVLYSSNSYMCLQDCTNKIPDIETSYWQILTNSDNMDNLEFKGNWIDGTQYYKNNIILYTTDNCAYIAILDSITRHELPTNSIYWNKITDMTAINTAESNRVTSENGRVSAESSRVSAESTRSNSESTRISNENTRISNESLRQTNESNRGTAETGRVNAEGLRVSAESNRVDAEGLRSTAEFNRVEVEEDRVSAESARSSSETTRNNNETTRQGNESSRSAAEGLRVTAENNRVSSETTRGSNETSRQSAESTRNGSEITRQNNENTRQSQETTRQTNTTTAINNLNSTNTEFQVMEDYDNTKYYKTLNKVQHNGSTYQCILDLTQVGTSPANDSTHWILVAAKGQVENVSWSDIQNKPTSSTTDIDDAVGKKHSHTNQTILDNTTASFTIENQTNIGTLNTSVADIIAEISDQDWGLITGSATSTDDYGSIAS